ncbi:MAG: site-2 protease family protein, partial [Flavobacteriia bacterium]|nr:site-2 protease family protein [Flavobacteriia bacterium]
SNVAQFKYVFTKKGASSVGGFGAIGKLFPTTWNWQAFWTLTALLSMMLAVMNLLPIPALDGGHVMFLLYEIITGRAASQNVMEKAQYVGFFLLIGLLLFANGNDLIKWLFG